MQPERWREIETIVQSAIDCEPGSRSALLDSACGDDAELRREVESLMALHQEGGFTGPAGFDDAVKVLEQRSAGLSEGRRIGAYRVLRQIGRGGMGSVHLAARADDAFQKLVAIKIILRGLDTEDIIRRFRGERQILAMLDHPNIARLIDGGATDDALPYFVMEYIEGEPIDLYCDRHQLSVAERLNLFQGVCAAVTYAHQNLVIHRDIKPANVLVTKGGVPRLLDFGIAKLLAPGISPVEGTLTKLRPLTPGYASPEQMRGETITTASDVYSLGVLLYELLTGKMPNRPAGPAAAAEPQRPSVAAGSLQGHSLRGDLDNIVLMAVQEEPRRRYASVEQLSEDLRRHLSGQPVIARADTLHYRATKFVLRHKAGVAASALLLLTLSAGILATARQARVARLETIKAQRINAFLQEMLSSSSPGYDSPNVRKDQDIKLSEVVEGAARRAQTELAGQPEVLAQIQRTIGAAYYAQGRYDQAEQILRLALDKYSKVFGHESPETVEASNLLANVLLRKYGTNNAEAARLYLKNIDIERGEARRGRLDVRAMAHALGDYGSMLDLRGEKSAVGYLREAIQYASRLIGKDRAYLAMVENDLGNVVTRAGDPKEAQRLYRAAVDEYRKLPEGTYVEMAAPLSNLGFELIRADKLKDAEPYIREGLVLRQSVLGNAHPDTAGSFLRMADLLYAEKDYAAAESAARESIAVFRRALAQPTENISFSSVLLRLGLTLDKTGRSREGESYLRQALAIRGHLLAPGNVMIASAQSTLAECLTTQKRFAEAESLLLDSYRILQSGSGREGAYVSETRRRLQSLYKAWHMPEKAAAY